MHQPQGVDAPPQAGQRVLGLGIRETLRLHHQDTVDQLKIVFDAVIDFTQQQVALHKRRGPFFHHAFKVKHGGLKQFLHRVALVDVFDHGDDDVGPSTVGEFCESRRHSRPDGRAVFSGVTLFPDVGARLAFEVSGIIGLLRPTVLWPGQLPAALAGEVFRFVSQHVGEGPVGSNDQACVGIDLEFADRGGLETDPEFLLASRQGGLGELQLQHGGVQVAVGVRQLVRDSAKRNQRAPDGTGNTQHEHSDQSCSEDGSFLQRQEDKRELVSDEDVPGASQPPGQGGPTRQRTAEERDQHHDWKDRKEGFGPSGFRPEEVSQHQGCGRPKQSDQNFD